MFTEHTHRTFEIAKALFPPRKAGVSFFRMKNTPANLMLIHRFRTQLPLNGAGRMHFYAKISAVALAAFGDVAECVWSKLSSSTSSSTEAFEKLHSWVPQEIVLLCETRHDSSTTSRHLRWMGELAAFREHYPYSLTHKKWVRENMQTVCLWFSVSCRLTRHPH